MSMWGIRVEGHRPHLSTHLFRRGSTKAFAEAATAVDRLVRDAAKTPHHNVHHSVEIIDPLFRARWLVTPPAAHRIDGHPMLHFFAESGDELFRPYVNWRPKRPPRPMHYEEAMVKGREILLVAFREVIADLGGKRSPL